MIKTISAKDAAEIIGVSYVTLNRWISEGKLTPIKVGRSNRFTEEQIAGFLGIELHKAEAERPAPAPVREYPSEDKQKICDGLLSALRCTRHYYDLEHLEYSREGRRETVTAFFADESKVIIVTAYEGYSNIEGKMMLNMIVLKNKDEWHEARSQIGGSDASAIVGRNPYKNNVQLFREKTGLATAEDISDKPYVQYGTNAEQHLRELFKLDFPEYEVFYEENNMWFNDKHPYAHASLDGWLTDQNGRKGILEIKTTEILQSMQRDKWYDRIPDNYYIQILHYLMVTEFQFAIMKAQLKTVINGIPYLQTKHYIIERNEVEEDINYLESAEKRFWENIKTGRTPNLILPEI